MMTTALRRLTAAAAADAEAARVLRICNACRYCEGFCAVFPAMTRRLEFAPADVHYLANLCHQCGACYHACQYAPPHEFAVQVPQAMARVRAGTYAQYAWPASFGRLYAKNGLTVTFALVLGFALMLLLLGWYQQRGADAPVPSVPALAAGGGNFYAVLPHGWMVAAFLPVFAFSGLALAIGARRFWRAAPPGPAGGEALREAAGAALSLRYLDGGHGEGCHETDERFTLTRRRWHHLTFYGFMLCLASTSSATVYHYAFGWIAPYGYTSLPKLLGISGGVALVVGTLGLWRLRGWRHKALRSAEMREMDIGLIVLLLGTGASGLALMLGKTTALLTPLLVLHLAFVMAFFLTMPYGKFAHGVYRVAALLKWAVERRLPDRIKLGSE